MGNLASDLALDLDGFLAWEEAQLERYERVAGIVRMMSGGTAAHDRIALNIARALHPQVRGGACSVQGANLKVVSRAVGAVMYPDVFVRCGQPLQQETSCEDPVVVFEVLSASTAQHDLTRKKHAYQAIESLRAIVYISQADASIEIVRRSASGWDAQFIEGEDAVLELPEIGAAIAFSEIYEDVDFPQPSAPPTG